VGPGLIQCMAALAHRIVENAPASDLGASAAPSILQLGGQPDSCYIWRAGGPGQGLRGGANEKV
jgi:hypothetical protein